MYILYFKKWPFLIAIFLHLACFPSINNTPISSVHIRYELTPLLLNMPKWYFMFKKLRPMNVGSLAKIWRWKEKCTKLANYIQSWINISSDLSVIIHNNCASVNNQINDTQSIVIQIERNIDSLTKLKNFLSGNKFAFRIKPFHRRKSTKQLSWVINICQCKRALQGYGYWGQSFSVFHKLIQARSWQIQSTVLELITLIDIFLYTENQDWISPTI